MVIASHTFQDLFNLAWLFPNKKKTKEIELYSKTNTMLAQLKNILQDKELTGLEKEILISMQKGLSSREIALLFNCTKEMISKHRQSILQKTKCNSMFDVISLAAKKGWV